MKKMVKEWVSSGITCQSTLAEIKAELESLIEKYGENTRIDFDSGYNNISESIEVEREETYKEYNRRIREEERQKQQLLKAKQKKEAQEKKMYKQLKKKYGEK